MCRMVSMGPSLCLVVVVVVPPDGFPKVVGADFGGSDIDGDSSLLGVSGGIAGLVFGSASGEAFEGVASALRVVFTSSVFSSAGN